MQLPSAFLDKMKNLLGANYEAYFKSYQKPREAGLRANTLKIPPEALQKLLPFLEEAVPWSRDGFYYDDEKIRPAKLPYYYAGLYYIQEPSAMLPAELLEVQPGDRVLDLCAAPGGKSLQLAAQLGGTGLLVVNDLNPGRAKVLLKNIERYGITNAIVLNESPEAISKAFPNFFNKILVDAPCSGEGMFRKEPDMIKSWSEEEVSKYVGWQADILNFVPKLLRPGGEVVYSTCTYSKEENEEQIAQFLASFPQFKLVEEKRLWPHEIKGEGHFAAKLKNISLSEANNYQQNKSSDDRGDNVSLSNEAIKGIAEFSHQIWQDAEKWQGWLPKDGFVVERKGHILWESALLPTLKGLKVLRSGWLLGTLEKGRFRPSPALALGLPREAALLAKQKFNLKSADREENSMAIKYLRGETLQKEGQTWSKGWYLVTLDDFPLGWAKSAGNWLKNEYPPGWRWMD